MMEKDVNAMGSGLTLIRRVAICFAAGVIGGLAVVLFSHVLLALGVTKLAPRTASGSSAQASGAEERRAAG